MQSLFPTAHNYTGLKWVRTKLVSAGQLHPNSKHYYILLHEKWTPSVMYWNWCLGLGTMRHRHWSQNAHLPLSLSLSSLALLLADSRRWFSMNMMLTDIMVRNGTHRISQITIEKLHEAHLWVPLRLQLQISHGLCSRNPLQKFWEIHGCEGNGATGAGIRKADLGWGSLEGSYIYNYSNVHIPIVQLVKKHKIIYIMQNII